VIRRTALVLLTAAAVASLAGPASAKGGSGGGTTPPPTTPPSSGPCVQLSTKADGFVLRGGTKALEYSALNCGSSTITITTSVTDTSWRVLYPDISCGTRVYAGPTLTLAPGRATAFSMATRRGTCTSASSEAHILNIDAFGTDPTTPLSTTFASWSEAPKTESR
jgi:hypothetical protein